MISTLIKKCNSPKEAISSIDQLQKNYKFTFKKNPKVDLAYSESGSKKSPVMGITVWHESDSESETELNWFKNQVQKELLAEKESK